MPHKLSIVVPVYNEAQTIQQVLDRVDEIDLGGIEKEVIVVDDGSTDGSAAIIAERMRRGADQRFAHLSIINLGKGAAVRFGFKHATGDIVMIQDADLELDPAECTRLIAPILAGEAAVVYGSRFKRPSPGISAKTRWANRLLTWCTNILFAARLTDMETAYKVFRRDVLEAISLRCVGFDIEPEITARVLQAGFKNQRVAGRLQPAPEGRRQEDLVDRRHRRHLHAAAVPRGLAARAAGRTATHAPMSSADRPDRRWLAGLLATLLLALALRAVFPVADPPWLAPIGITWHDEGVWAHNARNKALFGQWQLDQWNPMFVSPVFTGLEYLELSALRRRAMAGAAGVGRGGPGRDRGPGAGPAGHRHPGRRAGRRVAAGRQLHVGDVLAGGAAGGDDGRLPGGVVGVLRPGRARLALGTWRGRLRRCSRSSRRPRRRSS